jgi:flagellar basal body P-ring protein FlgI
MNNTVRRFFQLERAVWLLMTTSPQRRMRFLARLQRVGITFTKKVLIDHATGVVVQRHDVWSPLENMIGA